MNSHQQWFSPHLESLEDRLVLDLRRWVNPAGGSWHVDTNWEGAILPQPGDDVLIDVPDTVTVTHSTVRRPGGGRCGNAPAPRIAQHVPVEYRGPGGGLFPPHQRSGHAQSISSAVVVHWLATFTGRKSRQPEEPAMSLRHRCSARWGMNRLIGAIALALLAAATHRASAQELVTCKGHTDTVRGVAFAPDGKTVASSSSDKTIRIWEVATGKEQAKLEGHSNVVEGVAFSPDGKVLASASRDGTVTLWDMTTAKATATLKGHSAGVRAVAFGPDGKLVLTGGDKGEVKIWDVAAGKEKFKLVGHMKLVHLVAFAPDGKTVATAAEDGTVRWWDATTGNLKKILSDQNEVRGLAYVFNGEKLIAAMANGRSRGWFMSAGSDWLYSSVSRRSAVELVAFSPVSKIAVVASGTEVELHEEGSGSTALRSHTGQVQCMAFSPDGELLATAGADKLVKVWRAIPREAGQKRLPRMEADFFVHAVAFSPDGKTLVTAGGSMFGRGGGVKFWDPTSGKLVAAFEMKDEDPIRSMAFSPDGKTLALGRHRGAVELWDVGRRKLQDMLPVGKEMVHSVAFSPDGKRLAADSYEKNDQALQDDGFVKIWHTATWKEQHVLRAHTRWVASLAFSADSKTLATASWDKTAKLWDAQTGREKATLQGHTNWIESLAFSPDGNILATGSGDNTVRLWNAETGKHLKTLEGPQSSVQGVVFSHDGKTLAVAYLNGTVILWDAVMGKELAQFKAHKGGLACLAFSPDSAVLATGSRDETVKLWDVPELLAKKPKN